MSLAHSAVFYLSKGKRFLWPLADWHYTYILRHILIIIIYSGVQTLAYRHHTGGIRRLVYKVPWYDRSSVLSGVNVECSVHVRVSSSAQPGVLGRGGRTCARWRGCWV